MKTASILMFGGAVAPTGYLLCDGAEVSRTTYGDLFNVIGTVFGSGNGSTTFNVPDMRDRFPAGPGVIVGFASTGGDPLNAPPAITGGPSATTDVEAFTTTAVSVASETHNHDIPYQPPYLGLNFIIKT